ncbi:MAG: ABC-2 transporter permease [Pirellulales bacterium]
MSTAGIARKRLILKELRQLWPLIASSLIIAVLLYLLVLISRTNSVDRPMAWGVLVVGLPGLFAVGIGAMLVGQEKEQRTILWLQSLPLAKRDLVSSKLIAGLIGLAIVWIASLALVTLFAGGEYWGAGDQRAVDYWPSISVLPLHTLYLLLAGVAISWRVKSAFFALIVLVPVAFLPGLMAGLVATFLYPSTIEVVGSSVLIVCQLICCVAAAWLGWRYAMNNLSAAATAGARSTSISKTISFGAPYSKSSALLWQFAAQNKATLWASVVMFALSILFAFSLSRYNLERPYSHHGESRYPGFAGFMTAALAFLATSWLGVLVFQSDRINRRIRFLADRGLSPSLVWRTRHAIPVCICLFAGLLLVIVASWIGMSSGPSFAKFVQELATLVIFPTLLVLIATYSTSQWLSQLLPSPIVAAIGAPPAFLGIVVYYMTCISELGTPILLLAVLALVPLMVTRVLMRRWMDDRFDWNYWTIHIATPLICVVLPIVPLAYTWLTTPSMDSSIRVALEEQSKSNTLMPSSITLHLVLPLTRKEINERANNERTADLEVSGMGSAGMASALDEADSSPIALTAGPANTEVAGAEVAGEAVELDMPGLVETGAANDGEQAAQSQLALEDMPIQQRSRYIVSRLKEQMDTSSGAPASIDFRVLQWLRTELMINRLAALNPNTKGQSNNSGDSTKPIENQNAANENSANDSALTSNQPLPAERYNELLVLVARIAESVRRCSVLNQQELADRLEIVLVSELQQAQGKELISEETWESVCKVIGDPNKRNTARRMSLAASWNKAESTKYQLNTEFAAISRSIKPSSLVDIITMRSQVGHVVELLWKLSYSGKYNSDSIKTELSSILHVSPATYGLGNRGKFLKADSFDYYLFESSETNRLYSLGSQWNGQWEQLAEKLSHEQP